MAALITASAAEFAAAVDAGKLAGLDVGTRTIGLAVCDAGWAFAGPSETIRRTKFTNDLKLLSAFIANQSIRGLVVGLPLNMDGTDSPAHPVGPRLRPQPRAARPADPPLGRALVDPGRGTGDDRRRRQPGQERGKGRRPCRGAYPARRHRRAGEFSAAALGRHAREPHLDRFAERYQIERLLVRGETLVQIQPIASRGEQKTSQEQAGFQSLL